jgi:hypothetical protein
LEIKYLNPLIQHPVNKHLRAFLSENWGDNG